MSSRTSVRPLVSRTYRIVLVVLVALAVVAAGATILGLAPWLFLFLWTAGIGWALSPIMGWGRAVWGAVAASFFLSLWILVVGPYVGVRLDIFVVIALLVVECVIGALVWRHSGAFISIPRPRIGDAIAIAAPGIVNGVAFLAANLLRHSRSLSWAMHGDAQFNTVLARIVGADNGETASNVQVLSLAQGLMAIVQLPGRSALPADQLLLHDIARQSDMWIILIVLSSMLAGSIAQRLLRRATWVLRWVGIIGAALIPLAWYLTGYAMESGFYNVSVTFVVLELGVYLWLAAARYPWVAVAVAMATATTMLGAWTPMALLPLALAVASTIQHIRLRPPRREWIVWAVSVGQFGLFAALFVLPSFLTKGSLLSQNGTILSVAEPTFFLVVAVALIGAIALRGRSDPPSPQREFGSVLLLVAVAAVVGVLFLVFQNRALTDPWIYYPIKFAWISIELFLVLIWISAVVLVSAASVRRLFAALGMVATAVLIGSVTQLNPPGEGGVLAQFPILSLAKNSPPLEHAVRVLAPEANKRVIFDRYLGSDADLFMNQWLFQLTATSEFTPIRGYAYRVVSTVREVCDAAHAWGGGVTVITRDPDRARELDTACGDELHAVVRSPS